jgi:hypothetical protein
MVPTSIMSHHNPILQRSLCLLTLSKKTDKSYHLLETSPKPPSTKSLTDQDPVAHMILRPLSVPLVKTSGEIVPRGTRPYSAQCFQRVAASYGAVPRDHGFSSPFESWRYLMLLLGESTCIADLVCFGEGRLAASSCPLHCDCCRLAYPAVALRPPCM